MRSRYLPLLLGLAVLPLAQVLYPGCATLTGGMKQSVSIGAQPAAARILVDGKDRGHEYVSVRLTRWTWHRVRVELAGFEPCEFPLVKKFNQSGGGNLFLGVAPIAVDALSGAIFSFDVPADARLKYPREQLSTSEMTMLMGETSLHITVVLKPEPGGRKIGQMVRRGE